MIVYNSAMLTLYRRHTAECLKGLTKLSPRALRLFTDCTCPIWMYGRTGDKFVPRQATGTRVWSQAEAMMAAVDASAAQESVSGPRLDSCIAMYLDGRRQEQAETTSRHHARALGMLRDFCHARGVHFIREMKVDHIEQFKVFGMPGLSLSSQALMLAKVMVFLREALRREWIERPIADKVRGIKVHRETTSPFTDGEVDRILAGTMEMRHGHRGFAKYPATFQLLLRLMLETGMRVGDAVRYDPRKAQRSDELWVYSCHAMKRQRALPDRPYEVYLSDSLKSDIDRCQWLSLEAPFMWGAFTERNYFSREVHVRMKAVGKRIGVDDCRPHRFRDTFAVRLLLQGVQLDDVSRLLGHSSVRVTETYYAKWIPARARRLEGVLARALHHA